MFDVYQALDNDDAERLADYRIDGRGAVVPSEIRQLIRQRMRQFRRPQRRLKLTRRIR